MSQAYTNPPGLTLGPCTCCAVCEHYGCDNYSEASPQTTILPALMRPRTGEGVVGRIYSDQLLSNVRGWYEDNFDHGRPIFSPFERPGTPKRGAQWKANAREDYLRQ